MPDSIGNDCGCGVYAARLECERDPGWRDELPNLYRRILDKVPVGSAQHREVASHLGSLDLWARLADLPLVSNHDVRKLRHQFGTLGGGNHFIEIAADEEQRLWILVHSGSRYLEGLLKDYYQNKNLPIGEKDTEEFFQAQDAVKKFAYLSRKEMAHAVRQCIAEAFQCGVDLAEEIDLAHNFVALEEHGAATIAVHRKGACRAKEGEPGIIPGSMATGSYIVSGRGIPPSYASSSHGAARVMSRAEAFRSVSFRKLLSDMTDIVWAKSRQLIDEAPDAYKDINTVMKAQRDLVRVRHRLTPLVVVKGEA